MPPSQLFTNILDKFLQLDHICVQDFNGSSLSMESIGLLNMMKVLFRESLGNIILSMIAINDDTTMKMILTHPFTLPRGKANKGGQLPSQIPVLTWFSDPTHRGKYVGVWSLNFFLPRN